MSRRRWRHRAGAAVAGGAPPGARLRPQARLSSAFAGGIAEALRAWCVLLGALVVVGAAEAQAGQGRLFRIERPGIASSYVFGTLHSDDPRVTALDPRVAAAMDATRSAAFETLLGDGDVQAFLAAAQFDDGQRLSDFLDAAEIRAIRDALGADAPDPAMLARVKPWGVLLMLAQPRTGGGATLDGVLQAEARRRRMTVFGLELPEEQVSSLDAVPVESQVALARWALATRDRRAAEFEATTRAWLRGDLRRLRELALAPGVRQPELRVHVEALMRHLIANRNVVFAHRLFLPLRSGRVFVAVGALHLDGHDGLLALLRRQGYRVVRVFRRRQAEAR